MFSNSGSSFDAAVMVNNRLGSIVAYSRAVIAGRTCIVYTGSAEGACELCHRGPDIVQGGNTLSTAGSLRALIFDGCAVFPVLETGTDFSDNICEICGSNAGNSAAIYALLNVVVSGGVASLYLHWDRGGTSFDVLLGTVAAPATFYRILIHMFRDKMKCWFNGSACDDIVYANWTNEPLLANSVYLRWKNPARCRAAWDWLRYGIAPVSYSAALGESVTNGHPDNGNIWFIDRTALAGLVTGGQAHLCPVVDGSFTPPAVDGEYLSAKVLTDNSGGYAEELTRTGGIWTKG